MIGKPARVGVHATALAGVAFGWVVAARALLRWSSRSVAEQERLLAGLAARLPALSSRDVARAAWATSAAACRVPGTRCLAWSLALRALLEQMRVASRVRLGVAVPVSDRLDAHAWVECDGRGWSWGEPLDRYGVLRPAGGGQS